MSRRAPNRAHYLFAVIANHELGVAIARRELRKNMGFTDLQIAAGAQAALRGNPELAMQIGQKLIGAHTHAPKPPARPRNALTAPRKGRIF